MCLGRNEGGKAMKGLRLAGGWVPKEGGEYHGPDSQQKAGREARLED